MFHGKLLQKYWVETSWLPIFTVLSFLTPLLQALIVPLSIIQEITRLQRVFGCTFYPMFRDYTENKFNPRSLKCVFLGNNEKYKGFTCFLPTTCQVYISHHVVFDERKIPFCYRVFWSSVTNNYSSIVWLSLLLRQTSTPTVPRRVSEPQISIPAPLFTISDFQPLPLSFTSSISATSVASSPLIMFL